MYEEEFQTYFEASVNKMFIWLIFGCMLQGYDTNGETTNPSHGKFYASS